jgi:glycosyltransferase involved in cell wall biosynthesis
MPTATQVRLAEVGSLHVLIVHSEYQYRGGEEQAVANDRALLEARGHSVDLYVRRHENVPGIRGAGLALRAFWSARTYLEVRRLIRSRRPDVVHAHNIFPLISASVYSAAHAEGIPVVQTLHNYRLVCPASTLLRDGKLCELCVGHVPWYAVRYRCYRSSRAQSLALAAILTVHRVLGTWDHGVDAYIALTNFGREIFARGGLPSERIFIRHNAVAETTRGVYAGPRSAVYIGRLSPEKGLRVLLEAWRALPEIPLEIIGEGPLRDEIREAIGSSDLAHVRLVGALPHDEALARVAGAGMLVFPSLWYEGLPFAIVEALASGVPVIASRLGAQAEVVRDGVSGLLVTPGDARALADAVRRLATTDGLAERLADGARREFMERFSPDASYRDLLNVYERVTRGTRWQNRGPR